MDYAILGLLAAVLALLGVNLAATSAARKETAKNLQSGLRDMGGMLAENMKYGAETQDRRLSELSRQFGAMSLENGQRLDQVRTTMETRLASLQEDNNRKLEQMRNTVDEKLQQTLEDRITKSFQIVNEQLDKVNKSFGEMQSLAAGVGDLKRVLTNVKTRGNLGEIQLEAILEQILAPEQYEKNIRTRSTGNEKVEFAVRLPGSGDRTVYLPIDAKYPGDTYEKLLAAYDSGDKEEVRKCVRDLATVIKSEARDIRMKYIEPPYTTDFAILFLPVEGLYAEVVKAGLIEELQSQEYKVNIAGPTTMAALLNSLQMGFRTLAIQKYSSEVWDTLAAVKTEFRKFGDVLSKTRENLRKADENLEELVGARTKKINLKLKNVEVLGEGKKVSLETAGDGDAAEEDSNLD
jgi:DNA recombination protein RmuC